MEIAVPMILCLNSPHAAFTLHSVSGFEFGILLKIIVIHIVRYVQIQCAQNHRMELNIALA